ncbi:unnamed protein product, partial [Rotaria sp. Silwood1]
MVRGMANPKLPIDRARRVLFWRWLAQLERLWRRISAGFTIDM